MRLRGGVPRELLTRALRTRARLLERLVVGEELVDGLRKAGDVARGHDSASAELPHRLGDAADVVGDRGDPCAERAQKGAALVELGPVGEDGDGGLAEGAVDLRLREIAEPPLDLEPGRGGA